MLPHILSPDPIRSDPEVQVQVQVQSNSLVVFVDVKVIDEASNYIGRGCSPGTQLVATTTERQQGAPNLCARGTSRSQVQQWVGKDAYHHDTRVCLPHVASLSTYFLGLEMQA